MQREAMRAADALLYQHWLDGTRIDALPPDLRASIVSVGIAVQREMTRDNPDLDFLISINDNIAAGLAAPV